MAAASPRLLFLQEDLRTLGGGEVLLGRLARLAAAVAPVELALLFGGGTARARGLEKAFARVESFDYPRRVRLGSLAGLLRNQHALEVSLASRPTRACVATSYAGAFRGVLAAARTATPLLWTCNFSVTVGGGGDAQVGDGAGLATAERWRRSAGLRLVASAGAIAVCPSRAVAAELESLGYPRAQLRLIGVGVELGAYRPSTTDAAALRCERERRGVPPADLVAVCVARIDPVKDHELLVRAVAAASRAGVRVALVCVGVTEAAHREYAARVRDTAARLGVADRVLFVGYADDVPGWLALADVAVLASRKEAGSLFLVEAAASGLPLVGSMAGGIPDVVLPGETGYLFPIGDAESCASIFVRLAASESDRREMGAGARRFVERERGLGRIDAAWSALFAQLLAGDLRAGGS